MTSGVWSDWVFERCGFSWFAGLTRAFSRVGKGGRTCRVRRFCAPDPRQDALAILAERAEIGATKATLCRAQEQP